MLGAGGSILSHREPTNRYIYIDINPEIRGIAEQRFLKEQIRGTFIVDDTRRFVRSTDKRFDAVVIDVYSAITPPFQAIWSRASSSMTRAARWHRRGFC